MASNLQDIIGLRSGRRNKFFWIVFVVVMLILISSVLKFKSNLDRSLKANASERLMTIAESQRSLVQAHLAGMTRELEYSAATLLRLGRGVSAQVREEMQDTLSAGNFQWLTICDEAGRGLSTGDGQTDLSNTDAYAAAQEGKNWIDAQQGNVVISTPLLLDGHTEGMLMGGYSTERLTEFSLDYVRKYSSHIMIVRSDGVVLSTISSDRQSKKWESLEEFFSGGTLLNQDSYADVRKDMTLQTRGEVMLSTNGEPLLITYIPLEINDWYIFSMVPYKLIQKDITAISWDAYDISIKLFLAFILLLLHLLANNRHQVDALTAQQREMRAATARYKLITARSKDVILEYDVRKGFVVHDENAAVLSDPEMRGVNFMQNIVERGLVHPEDAGLLHKTADSVAEGGGAAELELRLKLEMSGYNWYRLDMVCVCDDEGRPWRVVARASNIDQQKREQQLLEQRAIRDPLTKLYNKTATRTEIDRVLEHSPNRCHALMIIDVDCFKAINDSRGHMYGDQVLQKASENITALFRSSDIAGRIGGDEFMIFFRDVGNCNNAARRAQQVCQLFRSVGQEMDPPSQTSCSVGVAFSPQDGISFEQLYPKADLALYSVKKGTKDGFAFFDSQTMDAKKTEKI